MSKVLEVKMVFVFTDGLTSITVKSDDDSPAGKIVYILNEMAELIKENSTPKTPFKDVLLLLENVGALIQPECDRSSN